MQEDIRAINELTHIAKVYLSRDDLDRAAEIMALVESIQKRVDKESNVVNLVDWWEPDHEESSGNAS